MTYFLLEETPYKKGQNNYDRLASPEIVLGHFHLNFNMFALAHIVVKCRKSHRFSLQRSGMLFSSENSEHITKTYLYNFDSLKPHFYIVKLGFTGVYIIFLISAQNIDCGYSLEQPRRGGSNEYSQSMFCAEI